MNDGFIVVGAGGWHSLGVMAMTRRDYLCFGVRRATVATVFQTRQSAMLAIVQTNDLRLGLGHEPIEAKIVRLTPLPKYVKGKVK